MLSGDTACQYLIRDRPSLSSIAPAARVAPPIPSGPSAPSVTPLLATSPIDADAAGGLILTVPPLPPVSFTAAPIQPPPTDNLLLSSPLPDLRSLSAYLPHWLDPQRSLVMLCTGLCASGPWSAVMLAGSERLFPGRSPRAVISKALLGAATVPIPIALYFCAVRLLQGHTLAEAATTVQQVMPKAWPIAGTYWPGFALLSFRFVPLQWRTLFGSVAMVAFQTFLSAQAHKPTGTASGCAESPLQQLPAED